MSTPLIIAAHGTRDADGEQTCRRFVDRVARALPDVKVGLGFVELNQPGIPQALTDIVDGEETRRAVVVPLMLGTGTHVRRDIPGFIVTLAGMLLFRGLTYQILDNVSLSPFPKPYYNVANGFLNGLLGGDGFDLFVAA